MKLFISSSGVKRLLHAGDKRSAVAPARRFPTRTVLLLGVFVLFLFLRVAFFVPEFPSVCNPCLANECIVWRFFGGCDSSMKLGEELTRALLEGDKKDGNDKTEGIESFNELVKLMTSQPQDIKTFAFHSKAMLLRMEHKVESAKQQESVYWQLASHGIPKGLNCLCLKLAEEYAVNAMARSCLPQPENVSRLVHPSYLHVVLLTDNVLAASVVISSTVQSSANPEKLVFHIVTDKKTYTSMHAWFALNPIKSAVVEVKGLHQYDWSQEVNIGIREMQEIHRLIWNHHRINLKEDSTLQHEGEYRKWSDASSPRFLFLLNHLRIYMPELFPDLNKVVFLDDDVVVQRDISSLWELDLNEKVIGAAVDSWCGENCCPGRRYRDYLNFSYQIISNNFEDDRCAWLYGMNVFDLEAWRRKNITKIYLEWLKHNLNFGLNLMRPGVLPPALLAFEGQVHPIDPSWHVAGLGYRTEERREILEAAAVIHFSGPAKPWLDIGLPEVRRLWSMHVNFSNIFIRECRIMG